MAATRHPCLDAFAAGLALGLSAVFAAGLVRGPSGGDRRASSETISPVRARPPPVSRGARAAAFRSIKAFNKDRIPTASAAVTFYMLLALFPGLSAFVSLYGLVADVEGARRRINALRGVLPGDAIAVLGDQLARLASADHGALGAAFFVSLLVSVWTANMGLKALIAGLNTAYETLENRGFVRLNLISLGFTTGVLGVAVLIIATIVKSSRFLARFGLPGGAALWAALLVISILLISLLYRFAPAHRNGRWRWISVGSATAAIGWMVMTAGFSWFVGASGHFDRVYGSLGAIVGFMTWIWLSLMIVLAGAQLNGDLERQRSSAQSGSELRPFFPDGGGGVDSRWPSLNPLTKSLPVELARGSDSFSGFPRRGRARSIIDPPASLAENSEGRHHVQSAEWSPLDRAGNLRSSGASVCRLD